jgi:isoamylase
VGGGPGDPWRRWIDTALASPQDIVPWQKASSVPGYTYRAGARSVMVLFADIGSVASSR